jgi:hypothetical protein
VTNTPIASIELLSRVELVTTAATINASDWPKHGALKRKKIEAGSRPVGALMLAERSSFADGAASRSLAGPYRASGLRMAIAVHSGVVPEREDRDSSTKFGIDKGE